MFVLDAAVALSWCFPDETNAYADPVLHRLADETALVPTRWPLEVANALVVGIRRGRLTREQAFEALHLLNELPIEVEEPIWSRVFDVMAPLALDAALSVYDAAYLDLAHRHQCPLATTDARLAQAATDRGIPLIKPSE